MLRQVKLCINVWEFCIFLLFAAVLVGCAP